MRRNQSRRMQRRHQDSIARRRIWNGIRRWGGGGVWGCQLSCFTDGLGRNDVRGRGKFGG